MTVGLDVRKLNDGGIGRYIKNVLLGAVRRFPRDRFVLFCFSGQRDTIIRLLDKKNPNFQLQVVKTGLYSLAETFQLGFIVNRCGLDVFHTPHYVLPFCIKVPCVVTVHDLIHLHFPEYLPSFPARMYARLHIRHAMRNARRVITVSMASKKDIAANYPREAAKLRVIYNGLSVYPASGQGKTGNFFLYVGNLKPHKNVRALIDVIWEMRALGFPVNLKIVTQDKKTARLQAYIRDRQLSRSIRFYYDITDRRLFSLYADSRAVVSASRYEGFGLPPAEAALMKRPVIVSDIPVFREILDRDSCLIQSDRPGLSAQSIIDLFQNRKRLDRIVVENYRKVSRFSIDTAVARTRRVYAEAVRESEN